MFMKHLIYLTYTFNVLNTVKVSSYLIFIAFAVYYLDVYRL